MPASQQSRLLFGSTHAYHTRCEDGDDDCWHAVKLVRQHVKRDRPHRPGGPAPSLELARVAAELDGEWFEGRLLTASWLVPVPSSAPLVEGGLWVPERIAQHLLEFGARGNVHTCLVRTTSIKRQKRGTSAADRPTFTEQLESLRFVPSLVPPPTSIVLVDDVVTSGTTALACAEVLRSALGAEVDMFLYAAIRALSEGRPRSFRFRTPATGNIVWTHLDRGWRRDDPTN